MSTTYDLPQPQANPTLDSSNTNDQVIQQALGGGSASGPPAVPGYGSASSTAGLSSTGVPLDGKKYTVTVGGYTLQLNIDPSQQIAVGPVPDGFEQPFTTTYTPTAVNPRSASPNIRPETAEVNLAQTQTLGNAPQLNPSGQLGNAPALLMPVNPVSQQQGPGGQGVTATTQPQSQASVSSLLNSFYNSLSNQTFKASFAQQAYQAGLVSSTTVSDSQLLTAYQAIVEQAATSGSTWENVLSQASEVGWSNLPSTTPTTTYGLSGTGQPDSQAASTTNTTTETYVSYMDPATAQGTLADSYYRLLGRLPTQAEYQSFLTSLYSYQQNENSGTYNETTKTPNTSPTTADAAASAPTTTTATGANTSENVIKQQGVGVRGAEFLAAQQAMNDPGYSAYQASTTYFHAFMQSLGGPGAGLEGSGPEVTAP